MSMISHLIEDIKAVKSYISTLMGENKITIQNAKFIQTTLNDAIDTIQTQGAKLANTNMERSLQYYNHGWIPCEDRLPYEYREYLCCDKYGNFIIGMPSPRYNEFAVETEYEIMHDCVAWMPLPAPFKNNETD